MNREILFRGRRTDNGEWVEGYLLHGSDKPYIVTWFGGDGACCWDCGIPHMDYFEVDPATVVWIQRPDRDKTVKALEVIGTIHDKEK